MERLIITIVIIITIVVSGLGIAKKVNNVYKVKFDQISSALK